jgi:hypothetical protein
MGECRAIRNVVILDLLPCSTLRLVRPLAYALSLELERERQTEQRAQSPTLVQYRAFSLSLL